MADLSATSTDAEAASLPVSVSKLHVSSTSSDKTVRAPVVSPDWSERFLNPSHAAASSSVLRSVVDGHSILVCEPDEESRDEWAALRDEATALACTELEERALLLELGMLDDVMADDAGRVRMRVVDRLSAAAQGRCDRLYMRALGRLATLEDAHVLFRDCLSATTCLEDEERFQWSPGEPAVNVYRAGGEFRPHEDEHTLTLLMPLTDACNFGGGGTAFWSLEDEGSSDAPERQAEDANGERCGTRPPALTIIPSAGSVLFFGGTVTHAAQAVTSGERCVFVGSFSPAAR